MYRDIRIVAGGRGRDVRAVVVVLFQGEERLGAGYRKLDRGIGGALSDALKRSEFTADKGALTTIYPVSKETRRLFVLGLGERERFTVDSLRIAAARLIGALYGAGVGRIDLRLLDGLGDCLDPMAAGQAFSDGLSIANFNFDTFKGAASEPKTGGGGRPMALTIEAESKVAAGLKKGLVIGNAVNVARGLAATPPNVANPAYLVRFSRKMARRVGLKCTVINQKRAGELKMNGLLAVGRAGSTPPALICLEHGRRGSKNNTILLVGKAVTFDTGGYSIKTGSGMENMKYDKCGGMAVLGAMQAIAHLKLPVNVVGLIAAAENMIGEKAYRPGDILSMHNGVTVEVTNTDAEGRLVLGDALAYGCKKYRPRAVIDLATLTGGVVVALGSYCAGAFCNHSGLWDHLLKASEYSGERLWRLPLWEEHKQQLKGLHGDIVNSAGRGAHPIQGAAFLSYFIDVKDPVGLPTTPWAHLDIAGVSDVKDEGHPLWCKGPTGFGVRLLVRAIETWKGVVL